MTPAKVKPMNRAVRHARAFTLIELLVVISIIIILMGLLFPAFRGVQDQAKRTQAKNDLSQLVTAVNAYYTEYGKYPLPANSQGFGEDFTYSYDGTGSPSNQDVMKILQGDSSAVADNPKRIAFFSGPQAKAAGAYGIQPASSSTAGAFYDPWGRAYSICIDSDYNNQLRERGTGNLLTIGVVAWSLGRDNDWDKSGVASWK